MGKYLGSLVAGDPEQLINFFKTPTKLLIFLVTYSAAYYLFILFIYSAIKLLILNLIKSLCKEEKLRLKMIGRFYALNISIFAIFLFVGVVLYSLLYAIFDEEFLKYIILILSIPFLFFLYSVINVSHTIFAKEGKKGVIKKGFSIAFRKIVRYGAFLIWDFIIFAVYLLIYNLIHLIFRKFVFVNETLLASYGGLYLTIFNIASLIALYLVISFNRVYFYGGIDKDVLS